MSDSRALHGLHALLHTYTETDLFGPDDIALVREEIDARAALCSDEEINSLEYTLPRRFSMIRKLDEEHSLTKHFPFMMQKISEREAGLNALLASKKKQRDELIAARRGVLPRAPGVNTGVHERVDTRGPYPPPPPHPPLPQP